MVSIIMAEDSVNSLKKRAIAGIAWSTIDKIISRGVSFVVNIVIARILMPSDYGVIGMLSIFITLSNLLVDSGMSQALVQNKNRTQADLSTAFYFNVIIGLSCYCILFLIAPLIASFYSVPILTRILRVIGLNVVFNSMATVQRANLLAKIDFKSIAIVNAISVLVSGAFGIYMAYRGGGVWSLVAQSLSCQLLSAVTFWIIGHWTPSFLFSKESFLRLWNYGVKLLVAGTLSTIIREINTLVIGKVYRQEELGYYQRAVHTTDAISGTMNEIVNTVSFPVLAEVQDQPQRLISVYSRMLSLSAFIMFPSMTLLAVLAEPLVELLLTTKWLPVVPLLQWLCFARMLTPISSINLNLLNAIGRSDLFLKVDLSKLPMTIIALVITLPISVKAVVIGNFITTFISYFINAYLPGKMFGFGVKAQFHLFYKIIIASLLMAIIAIIIKDMFQHPFPRLVVVGFISLICYLIICRLFKLPVLKECWELIVSKTRRS